MCELLEVVCCLLLALLRVWGLLVDFRTLDVTVSGFLCLGLLRVGGYRLIRWFWGVYFGLGLVIVVLLQYWILCFVLIYTLFGVGC